MNPVTEFEKTFKEYTKANYCLAVNNGTAALITALKTLNVEGKKVGVTPYTFPATANAIIHSGGIPCFIDINDNYRLSPKGIFKALGDGVSHFLIVHLFGKIGIDSSDYIDLINNKVTIIEDCSQALGLELLSNHVGTLSQAGTFSFYATKNLSTYEGGMVTFFKKKNYETAKKLINHGFNEYNQMEMLGYNFKMPWLNAFIGEQTLKLHKPAIKAELGRYSAKDGYYPLLVYQHPWYQENKDKWIKTDCSNAEKLAKEVKENMKK